MTRRTTIQFIGTIFGIISLVATIGYAIDPADSRDAKATTTPVAERRAVDVGELDGASSGRLRLREGVKLVDQIGELRDTGGPIAFYPDGEKHSLQLLENLALERVTRDLDQSQRKWSVTGIVTEYRGGNYLLLHRAVLKARVPSTSAPRN